MLGCTPMVVVLILHRARVGLIRLLTVSLGYRGVAIWVQWVVNWRHCLGSSSSWNMGHVPALWISWFYLNTTRSAII